jgi:hypothetical protein
MVWNNVAQYRNQRKALINTIMNLRIKKNCLGFHDRITWWTLLHRVTQINGQIFGRVDGWDV